VRFFSKLLHFSLRYLITVQKITSYFLQQQVSLLFHYVEKRNEMPHFGLMNERNMGPVEGPFLRARLHMRGGKRRLRQGKIAAGIVTLYDALNAAMQAYVAAEEHESV